MRKHFVSVIFFFRAETEVKVNEGTGESYFKPDGQRGDEDIEQHSRSSGRSD
jgi:hypothetical protein